MRSVRLAVAGIIAVCALSAQTDQPPPPPPNEGRAFLSAMAEIANVVVAVRDTAKRADEAAAVAHTRPALPPRPWKESMAIVSGGAVSGAAIGAAAANNGKGAIYGAIAGSVAALIYDRITARDPR